MRQCLFVFAFASAISASQVFATQVQISTDHTGANTQIDSAASAFWNFSVTAGHVVTALDGNFSIKVGNSATDNIYFKLYSGFQGTTVSGTPTGLFSPMGTLLGSATVLKGNVTNQYTPTDFLITGLNLAAGNYSATLTSNTGTNGSEQYFFKDSGLTTDSPGIINVNPSLTPSVVVSTPEPATFAAAGFGLLVGLGALYRRRARHAA